MNIQKRIDNFFASLGSIFTFILFTTTLYYLFTGEWAKSAAFAFLVLICIGIKAIERIADRLEGLQTVVIIKPLEPELPDSDKPIVFGREAR